MRPYSSPLDRVINRLDRSLRRVAGVTSNSGGATSSAAQPEPMLTASQRQLSQRLMRVNHAGEIAAQALYRGQQLFARSAETHEYLKTAASEEQQHLDWCKQRLDQLGGHPSRLDPLWFAGAYVIGAAASACGDRWSLGFIAETERQVVNHLDKHIERLPKEDQPSREILEKMRNDEAHHSNQATKLGGHALPSVIRAGMFLGSQVMVHGAYYL